MKMKNKKEKNTSEAFKYWRGPLLNLCDNIWTHMEMQLQETSMLNQLDTKENRDDDAD